MPGFAARPRLRQTNKTIVLERKLPAAVKLPGNAFDVKVSAQKPQDPCGKPAAEKLQSRIETSLSRFNSQLELNPDKPDTLIVDRSLTVAALIEVSWCHRCYPSHDRQAVVAFPPHGSCAEKSPFAFTS